MKRQKKYLSSEDLALREQEFLAKYEISRATYYRAKKSGYFVPEYHKRIINIDNSFVEKNWGLIVECSTISVLVIIKQRRESAFGRLFKFNDLRDEALLKIVEKSGEVVKQLPQINDLRGFLINMGINAVKDFIKMKVYKHSKKTLFCENIDEEFKSDNPFINVDAEKFIEDIKEAIISQYGEYSWEMVWKWANSDIKKVSQKIQTILDSVCN